MAKPCRSWGGCAQMDQQQTRNFLHQRNGEMDRRSEEMYGHKWWLCWKISVQCWRELNFLHSDITVIILHGQILILYNWRPYLSITPRICSYRQFESRHRPWCIALLSISLPSDLRVMLSFQSKMSYIMPGWLIVPDFLLCQRCEGSSFSKAGGRRGDDDELTSCNWSILCNFKIKFSSASVAEDFLE